MIVWSFKILITIVLALICAFVLKIQCPYQYLLKDTIFVKFRCIIAELQVFKVEQFPIHLL